MWGARSPRALIRRIERQRIIRWNYASTLTFVGTLHGATTSSFLNTAELKEAARLLPIVKSKRMREYECQLKRAQVIEHTDFPRACSTEDIHRLVNAAQSLQLKSLIIVAWICAGRIADVIKLRTMSVQVKGKVFLATFREGKAVSATHQAFTIATDVGPYSQLLTEFRRTRQASTFLFSASSTTRLSLTKRLKELLRAEKPVHGKKLELRSFRRGALQTMGSKCVTTDVLRHFSQHASEKTLLRYLDWGRYALDQHLKTTSAAARLW